MAGGEWQKWVLAILVAVLLWFFWRNRKGILKETDISKSFKIMGILALILIVFVGFLIVLARH